jgi:hypothetical protein
MEAFMESVFGNRFFELPFLEALSYIAVVLMIGAIVVGITRRIMGYSSQPAQASAYGERQYRAEEELSEWRKAA